MFLSSDEIDLMTTKREKEKQKLLNLIIKIYANYGKNFLIVLIKSKNGANCSRILLDLLTKNELKIDELSFENEKELNPIQGILLHVVKSKDEINYVVKISQGLINLLKFVYNNYKEINDLIEKYAGYFQNKKNNYLTIDKPKLNDNIEEIYTLLSNIINLEKNKKFTIINYEDIFKNFVNLFKKICLWVNYANWAN